MTVSMATVLSWSVWPLLTPFAVVFMAKGLVQLVNEVAAESCLCGTDYFINCLLLSSRDASSNRHDKTRPSVSTGWKRPKEDLQQQEDQREGNYLLISSAVSKKQYNCTQVINIIITMT